ncbi:uncharacterized protein LOC121090043 [Falco naumanni]|uniref:uncharacterized protein LOC121090043 n=1 Tax=Falco naumanni TaxID=148594 RepID=UPI001ADE9086|nr:uncharacterized protein LOC121090043 [Falco naumanni]
MLATLWADHGIYIPYVSMRLQNDLCFLPRPFRKLQLAPVNYKAETPFQPDFDTSALREYMRIKITKTTTSNWYNQTSHKAAYDLLYLNTSHGSKYTPTDPGPYIIWTSTGRRMFSAFQACSRVEESKKTNTQLNLKENNRI